MTLEEATQKVSKLAENNGGKVNAVINFKFDEGMIHLDDTVSPTVVSNEDKNAACTIKMSLSNFEKTNVWKSESDDGIYGWKDEDRR